MDSFLKITPLVENKSKNKNLLSEHGLSLLIEYDNQCILFDTGASDCLIKNVANLDVDLEVIDSVVLSHGHCDHVGGLEYLSNKKVYIQPTIFAPKYTKEDVQYEYSGFPHKKEYYEKNNRLMFVDVPTNLQLTKNIKLHVGFNNEKVNDLFFLENDGSEYDYFADELVLSINTNDGLVIVTGCAHSGVINILDKVLSESDTKNIYALLGGFHLGELDQEEVKQIAEKIDSYHINKLGVSHCTGGKLAKYIKNSRVFDFNVGDQFVC